MTKLEKIESVKNLYEITNALFKIPDNCPGDGWIGVLCEKGAFLYGSNEFDGEYFKYEDMDESVLDTILDEAEFDGYDFENCTLETLLKMVKENCSVEMLMENAQAFITNISDYKLFLLDCIKNKRNSKS